MNSGSDSYHQTARGSAYLLLAAAVGFTAAVRGSTAANALFVVPAVGLLLIAMLRQTSTTPDNPARSHRLTMAIWTATSVVALSALFEVRLPALDEGREPFWYWSACAWMVVVAVAWVLGRRRPGWLPFFVWPALVIVAVEAGLLIWLYETPGIDVYHLHEAASAKLRAGSSPYFDLGILDSSPSAVPGSVIDGYPYPPATLIWFSLGSWIGDPRIASTLAWLLTLALVAKPVIEKRGNAAPMLGLLLLLAAQPGWEFVISSSWTETFTLLLIVAAFVNWHRLPFTSGLLLGLAIVSKQYMVVLLPATLIMGNDRRKRRIIGMASSALLVTGPFAIAGLKWLWHSTVLFHLSSAPRPDSSNLTGLAIRFDLSWTPPAWLVLIIPTALSIWIVRRTHSLSGLALAYAAGLSVFFFLASQAFANYWFLVQGLTVLVVALSLSESPSMTSETSARRQSSGRADRSTST